MQMLRSGLCEKGEKAVDKFRGSKLKPNAPMGKKAIYDLALTTGGGNETSTGIHLY